MGLAACCYWVDHLQRSGPGLGDDSQVTALFQEHFLHWLEAMSLIGKMSEGVLMVAALQSIVTVSGLQALM